MAFTRIGRARINEDAITVARRDRQGKAAKVLSDLMTLDPVRFENAHSRIREILDPLLREIKPPEW